MPTGIYIHKKLSEETIQKIKNAISGEKHYLYNKNLPEETKKKISDSLKLKYKDGSIVHPMLGKHFSEESKLKMSLSHIGKPSGRKGKHISEEVKQKISKTLKGSCKGRKLSEEWIKKIVETRRNNGSYNYSEESKNKNRLAHLGKKLSQETISKMLNSRKWYKHSEETKAKIILARKNQILPFKDTIPEIRIQNLLKEIGYEFFTHQYIKDIEHGYQCDILVPYLDLVIECDGDYWHKYPIGNEIDKIHTSELLSKGFKVLRLWEHEIEFMSSEDLKRRIKNDCF